ncbi:MAG: GlsB/YeaQ/YmgE family stress response membrane protein, partial [Actinomycetota bacterium]
MTPPRRLRNRFSRIVRPYPEACMVTRRSARRGGTRKKEGDLGFIGDLLVSGDQDLNPAGLIGSILGAVIVLLVYRAVVQRRTI